MEHKRHSEQYSELVGQLNELNRQVQLVRQQRFTLFLSGFGLISQKLREIYQHLTRGGDASLELMDSLDPFAEGTLVNIGIQFSIRPPKKTWKQICKLSGGEKTLSSLALLFALHVYRPSPLYILDEIDAALDYHNIATVADYITQRTTDTQVTH